MAAESLAAAAAEKTQLTIGILCWMVCSIGMMVFNKLAIKAFPVECTLVAFQMIFSVVILLVFGFKSIHIGSWWDVARWARVVPFFTGMLLSSILALKFAPMSLVVVFRVLSPLVSLMIERFYPDPLKISMSMVLTILVMLGGVVMYASALNKSSYAGIGWVFLNNFFAIGDRLMQRLMLAKDQSPVDISKAGATLLNNLLGMIPLIIVAAIKMEFPMIPAAVNNVSAIGWVWVACSCVVGVLISYSGIWVQSYITATSFLVLVNSNKFVIILIECFIMATKKLTPVQIGGSFVTILAGVAYAKVREQIEESEKAKKAGSPSEKTPLAGKNV